MHGVELVEARSQGFQIGRQRMNFPTRHRAFDYPREVEEFQEQGPLLGGELAGRHVLYGLRIEPGPAEDARDAGVGVLHVVDWVLVGLLNSDLEVEVHLGAVRGANVEVPRGVLPHLVQELVEGNEVPGTLADLDLLPAAYELYQPHEL